MEDAVPGVLVFEGLDGFLLDVASYLERNTLKIEQLAAMFETVGGETLPIVRIDDFIVGLRAVEIETTSGTTEYLIFVADDHSEPSEYFAVAIVPCGIDDLRKELSQKYMRRINSAVARILLRRRSS